VKRVRARLRDSLFTESNACGRRQMVVMEGFRLLRGPVSGWIACDERATRRWGSRLGSKRLATLAAIMWRWGSKGVVRGVRLRYNCTVRGELRP
jgi:hypothetical protein